MRLTTDDIAKALRGEKADRLSVEGFTGEEFREMMGVASSRHLQQAVKDGIVKLVGRRESPRIDGTRQKVPVYQLVEDMTQRS